jgi:hypothetical protein
MSSLINKVANKSKDFLLTSSLASPARKFAVKTFGKMAESGRGSNQCLEEGFLPVPVHFYSPIPDIKDLEMRDIWNTRSSLAGIDFKAEEQLEMLSGLGQRFGAECKWPFSKPEDSNEFFLNNQSFSFGCAASTHCMIRNFKPDTVIEIGSGMSSLVISKAIEVNAKEISKKAEYKIVDPYPNEFVELGLNGSMTLNKTRVEFLKPEFFSCLKENDILFIDSSHSVKIGSDVNYLYLEVLPRLADGVIVHIHDISLPYEYPKAYAVNETFRQFWTEQYLLQSFLCHNDKFEVLLGLNYIMADHLDLFKKAFPFYDPEVHLAGSSSFWIKRKLANKN